MYTVSLERDHSDIKLNFEMIMSNVRNIFHSPPPSGTVAHKIMQKYGFREGQGLGKHEQGLSTALSVEKTSKRGGKIIVGDAMEKGEAQGKCTKKHCCHGAAGKAGGL